MGKEVEELARKAEISSIATQCKIPSNDLIDFTINYDIKVENLKNYMPLFKIFNKHKSQESTAKEKLEILSEIDRAHTNHDSISIDQLYRLNIELEITSAETLNNILQKLEGYAVNFDYTLAAIIGLITDLKMNIDEIKAINDLINEFDFVSFAAFDSLRSSLNLSMFDTKNLQQNFKVIDDAENGNFTRDNTIIILNTFKDDQPTLELVQNTHSLATQFGMPVERFCQLAQALSISAKDVKEAIVEGKVEQKQDNVEKEESKLSGTLKLLDIILNNKEIDTPLDPLIKGLPLPTLEFGNFRSNELSEEKVKMLAQHLLTKTNNNPLLFLVTLSALILKELSKFEDSRQLESLLQTPDFIARYGNAIAANEKIVKNIKTNDNLTPHAALQIAFLNGENWNSNQESTYLKMTLDYTSGWFFSSGQGKNSFVVELMSSLLQYFTNKYDQDFQSISKSVYMNYIEAYSKQRTEGIKQTMRSIDTEKPFLKLKGITTENPSLILDK
ncbi:hypothetical protein L3V86_02455 [Thiotrichales bacterium 19S11-10]|nr:hypothetical protein [Thiotrichales bacterium 19S11-10]